MKDNGSCHAQKITTARERHFYGTDGVFEVPGIVLVSDQACWKQGMWVQGLARFGVGVVLRELMLRCYASIVRKPSGAVRYSGGDTQ
jgi:hypothetical protein